MQVCPLGMVLIHPAPPVAFFVSAQHNWLTKVFYNSDIIAQTPYSEHHSACVQPFMAS